MFKLSKTMLLLAGVFAAQSSYANSEKLIQVNNNNVVPNKYIVVFKSNQSLLSTSSVAEMAQQNAEMMSGKYGIKATKLFGNTLNGGLFTLTKGQLKELLQDDQVQFIEQEQIFTVDPQVSTNANQGNAIWGLDRIDQRALPLDSNYQYNFDGTGVTAYVIDTGVRNSHNEFGNRATSGWDFVDNDSDASDCNGHGTHVAGTIGGQSYGVAKNVNIVGVRVLGCNGSGSTSGVIGGIDWVKNNASGPSVANMSLGGGASSAIDQAVEAAVASGVSFVVAAGNDNSNACNYSPARAGTAITVGSTTSSDSRSSFSNYGNCLDIYAPGSSIKSAWYNSNSATNTISGTSMAAPHVAGVVALYLDENGSLTPSQIDSKLASGSTKNVVSDAKSGSPNELLYALDGSTGPDPDPDPDPSGELTNDQAVAVSGATGSETNFFIDVPAGQSNLSFTLSGGSGDADLYVKQGSAPTTGSYDCRPYRSGNNENCDYATPAAGKYYVMIQGYSAYSGASLVASYSADAGCTDCLDNGVPVSSIAGATGSQTFYKIEVPANTTLTVTTANGSGDVDLYVKKGAQPTTGDYDCRPYRWGNNETCSLNSGTSGGTYHIMLNGYSAFSGVTLTASY